MSKRTSTRWYIGAWVLWVLAWIVVFMTGRTTTTGTSFFVHGSSPVGAVALIAVWILALVMLVMWLGALIRLGQLHSWGWFVAVLVLQLVGLGIVGMAAYAIGGPPDDGSAVVMRPTAT